MAAADDGNDVVQQPHEQAREARLGLPPLAEEDEVLAGQDRVLDGGQDRLVETDDPGEDRHAFSESRKKVCPQLLLDGPRPPAGGPQLPQGDRTDVGLLGVGGDVHARGLSRTGSRAMARARSVRGGREVRQTEAHRRVKAVH